MPSPPPQSSQGGIAVSVGYADNSSASPSFPAPWQGAPNTVFIGGGNNYNAGAIRLDNTTSSAITVSSVTVDLQRPGPSYNLWNNFTIPALGSAILTQTSAFDFNTSASPIVSCGASIPSGNTQIPKITVTTNGNPSVFLDTAHVLDTGGFDLGCRGNRSLAWRPAGTSGIESPTAGVALSPDGSITATGASVTLTAQATDASGQPLANAVVAFKANSGPNANVSGQATTNAQGVALFTYSGTQPGSDVLQASLLNLTGTGASSNTITANWSGAGACLTPTNPPSGSTSLIYLGQTSVQVADSVRAAALLVDGNGTGLAGRNIVFTFQSQTLSAATDNNGYAQTNFTASAPGSQAMSVSYAGETGLQPATAAATVTIAKKDTTLTYTGATLLGTGVAQPLSAKLTDNHGLPLANRTVVFQVGSVVAGATTNASGIATASLTLGPSAANSTAQVQISFAGDANYNASYTANPVDVFLSSAFVIWGGNSGGLHLGQDVQFWGATWANQVTAGNYAANTAFKGFANSTASPIALCEASATLNNLDDLCWNTKGGNTEPSDTLPQYIGVIVSTAIEKQGTEIFGNVAALAVLKVDASPVYGSDPGHPGFGTIVAILADGAHVFPTPATLTAAQSQPATVLPGQAYTVNAVVTNSGQTAATNLAVSETFDGVTPASGNQGTASLPSSQQFTPAFNETAPTYPVRQSGETSAAYQSRLAAVDGRSFTSSGTVTFTDSASQPYLPLTITSFSQLQIPRLKVSLSGPACVNPGGTLALLATVTNLGSATATGISASVTLPDGSTSLLALNSLDAGMSFAATVNFRPAAIPPIGNGESTAAYLARLAAADGGSLTAGITANWKDALANSYGAVDQPFSAVRERIPILGGALTTPSTLLPGSTATIGFTAQNTGGGNAIEADLQVVNPDGSVKKAAPFTVLSGQSVPAATTWTSPAAGTKQTGETDSAYLSRLSTLDNGALNFTSALSWKDAGGSIYGPTQSTGTSTRILPILTINLTGPASANAGSSITYNVSVQNTGHASASTPAVILSFPDNTTATLALTPSGALAPGATATATANFSVPATSSGQITATAAITWNDANGNAYGSLSSSAATNAIRLTPTLTGNASVPSSLLPGSTATVSFVAQNTGTANAVQSVLQVTNPDSSVTSAPPFSVAAGQSASASTTWPAPAISAKQGGESDAAYQARLASLDNAPLVFATSLTWNDSANSSYGPVTGSAQSTRILPILTVNLNGPATANSGNAISYTLTLQNIGHAAATPSLTVSLPDNTTVTPALSPGGVIAPGGTATATIPFTIAGTTATGQLSATASATWKDVNNNSYGPQSATAMTSNTRLIPTLTGAPAATPNPVLPGGTVTVTLPAQNSGTGDALSVTLQTTNPDGNTNSSAPATVPVGQTVAISTTWPVPAILGKQNGETDAAYQSRLTSFDNTALNFVTSLAWKDSAATSYGPLTGAAQTKRALPILTLNLAAPAASISGSNIAYTVTVVNVGHAAGTPTVTITLPGGTTATPALSPAGPIAPGGTATGTVNFAVLGTVASGQLNATANVNWIDANNTAYGPQSSTASTNNTRLTPILTDTPTVDATLLPGATATIAVAAQNIGTADALQTQLKITNPDGTSSTFPAFTVTIGQTVSNSSTWTVPVIPARLSTESDADYQARLTALDNSTETFPTTLNWIDNVGSPYGPLTLNATSSLVLPIVTAAIAGPAITVNSGSTITYAVTVKNIGHSAAPAAGLLLSVKLPDGSLVSPPLTPAGDLAPNAMATATVNYTIPAGTNSGNIVATASVVWQDSIANNYGPLAAAATTSVHRPVPILTGTPTVAPTSLVPGSTATISLTAQNTGDGNAANAGMAVTNPDGSTRTSAPLSVAAGASSTATTTWTMPAVAAKQSTETGAAYQARLTSLDNASLTYSTSLTWQDAAGTSYGPVTGSAQNTRILPILTVSLTGPATSLSGTSITYTLTIANVGHAPGTPAVAITLPDGTVVTPALTPSGPIAAGGTTTATVTFAIPPAAPTGSLVAAASVSWTDANANTYGPQAAIATTANARPIPTLTGTPSAAPAAVAPGGTVNITLPAKNTGNGDALSTILQTTNPDNATASSTATTVPAGQTISVSTTWPVPVISAKQAGETDSAYQSRLAGFDNTALSFTTSLTWKDGVPTSYGPVTGSAQTTRVVPIFTVSLSGPASATSGSAIAYTFTVQNAGHAAGTPMPAIVLPDGSAPAVVLSPVGSLAPGASAQATIPFNIPQSSTGNISATASLQWRDANNNVYGPQSAAASTAVASALTLTVNAGSNQSVATPQNLPLQGVVTASPGTAAVAISWTQVSGPATVTFSNPQSPTSTVHVPSPGTYDLQLKATANNGTTTVTQISDVILTATAGTSQPPVVSAGPNLSITLPATTATLNGSVSDPNGSFTVSWSKVSGPGPVTFASPNSVVTQATFSSAGAYVVKLTAVDSQFTGSATAEVIVNPAITVNQPPVVNAGPSQAVTVSSNASLLPLAPVISYLGLDSNSAIGIDYHQPTNKLLMTVNSSSGGAPYNLQLMAPNGTAAQFSTLSGLTGEVFPVVARDEGGGKSIGGFPAGTVFIRNAANVVARISPDGSNIQTSWAPLPGETGVIQGQPHIDRTGVWGGDLFVVTTSGNLWRIGSDNSASPGVPVKLATLTLYNPIESILAVPNEPLRYGPWAGKLLIGSDAVSTMVTVDPQGNQASFDVGVFPAHLKLIGPNESYFAVDSGKGCSPNPCPPSLITIPAAQLAGFVGNVLVGEEDYNITHPVSQVWILRWNQATQLFERTSIGAVNSLDGGVLAPAGLLSTPPSSASATLAGTVVDTDGLPVGGTLTYAWSKISGPGTATFSNPSGVAVLAATPATSVTLSEPGIYVLRLTGNDSQLSATSDVTVTVNANHAPVVNAGTEQQGTFPNPVTVPGMVTDDGLPSGGQLSAFWTKVNGPGKITSPATYSASDDFSLTANPNGPWSYGWEPYRGGPFTLFAPPARAANTGNYIGLPTYYPASGNAPTLGYNNLLTPKNTGAGTIPPTVLSLLPGTKGENAVLRWTAPSAGTYLVQGKFEGEDPAGNQADAAVLLTSGGVTTALVSGDIVDKLQSDLLWGPALTFTFVRAMNAGDTLDFTVGYGNDNTNAGDDTTLSVTITPAGSSTANISFSRPGDYLLRLVGYDGELFGYGDVRVRSTGACLAPPSGLVGWWKGEGNTNDLINGNTGFAGGALSYTSQGEVGQAFNFSGQNSDVDMAGSAALNVHSLTFSAWIFPNNVGGNQALIEYSQGGYQPLLGANLWLGGKLFQPGNPGGLIADLAGNNTRQFYSTGGLIQAGRWSHVALTYDQATGNAVIYINGASAGSANVGLGAPTTNYRLFLGLNPYYGGQYTGNMDEIQVFNRALSAAEIQAIYNADGTGLCNPAGAPPAVNAGANQTVTLPANVITANITLSGTVTNPSNLPLTISWSEVSGPGVATFTNPASPATTATLTGAPGVYILRLTANDGVVATSSDVTVTANAAGGTAPSVSPPSVNAGAGQSIQLPVNSVTLSGSASDPGGTALTLLWNQVSGPPGGTTNFATPTQAVTQATFSAPGIYTLQLTAVNAQASASATTMVVVNPQQPQPPVVGNIPSQNIQLPVNTLTINETASDPAGLPLTYAWSLLSGPAGVVFSAPAALSTQVTFSNTVTGTYTLQFAASSAQFTTAVTFQVTVVAANTPKQPPAVTAGANQTITLPGTATLTGTAIDPAGFPLTVSWVQTAGPATAGIASPSQQSTVVTFPASGAYTFQITANNGTYSSSASTTVTVNLPPPPAVSAGSGQTFSLPTLTATLNGSASDPAGLPLTIAWSQLSGPAGVQFASPSKAITQATFPGAGTFVLQLSGSDAVATTTATVTIMIQLAAPVVNAGASQGIQLPATAATLSGAASDPGGNPLTLAWTQVSGPVTGTIASPTAAATQVTGLSATGTYVFRLTASNAQVSSSATTSVVVAPASASNQAPVVSAGGSQTITWPANTVTLNGAVTDDGLPAGAAVTQLWTVINTAIPDRYGAAQSQVSGGVLFANPTLAATQATFSTPGVYTLKLTASDTALTSSATITVTVNPPVTQPPLVTIPASQTIQLPNNTAILNGTAASQPAGHNLTIVWSKISGPGTVTFANAGLAATTATFGTAGTYTLQLQVTDGTQIATGTTQVLVLGLPTPPPTISFVTPASEAEVTQPTAVKANVSNGAWTLSYALFDDTAATQSNVTLASGVGAVNGTTLATFDPTLLLNGTYQFQLVSVDSVGQSTTATRTVTVARNMKIGVFSLSFNDLTVPVTGLPITITRSYDSRDKRAGDFGVGWRLSIANVRLQKNRNIGLSWFEDLEYAGTLGSLPQFCLQPTSPRIVTAVFPDNRVFKFQTVPQCLTGGAITNPTIAFQQMPTSGNTAGATLVPADGGGALIDGGVPGTVNVIGFDGNLYNPTVFLLTTAQGVQYTIDQSRGVTAISDANGNTLSINAGGISGSGVNVTFTRDAQNRITKITDPNGGFMTYGYTGADLTSFTDRASNTTTFSYAAGDYLTGITTPNNVQVLNNNYDASGRLLGTADAFNKSIAYTHDIPNRTETVTDRLGNSTAYVYDADGNILSTTDALNNVTSSTYDSNDQKLSDTNALGKTTNYAYDNLGNLLNQADPLGNVTTYTYNNLQKVLTVADPKGNTTTNTYDTHGNLLTVTDAASNVTTNTYTFQGLLFSTKDANNKTTSFTYDSRGNLLTQADPLNRVTTSTYDLNGNRVTQTVVRGGVNETTSFTYDGLNRLTKTTFPDNTFTQTHYNTLGQVDSRTDQRGKVTSYLYDNDGRLTTTTYADSTTDNTVYDAEGRRTQTTNRGIVTNFTYDKAGRLKTTSTPVDNATTTTNYDGAGQVTSTVDARNNTTSYAYDDAGRRTSVTNALTQVTAFTYDTAGNQLTVKDARNNVTTNTYDADNRLTKVTYPDAKFDSTAYDAVGRVSSRTDAAGKTTQYGYDALGRLTSVTDALNQVTSYAYDEVGNRLSQTDANNHTTNYQYDSLGRRTKRTLPLGQFETYAYDAAGNLQSRTDFNGRTTTYAYDSLNRLLTKTPDASFSAAPISFTYTATGKRQTMSDPSGTTTYGYDTRDRLTSKVTPEGTLTYGYDLGSNLTSLSTSGLVVNYTYDVLNRLSSVADANTTTTSYAYDPAGNLASFGAHNYTYDSRNRLTNLTVGNVASYAYTLDDSGHRTQVVEKSGRTVNYSYDNVYRLTSEAVANVGAVSYTYDPVGNRRTLTSTLAPIQSAASTFDNNDRLSSDTYDSNGNTTQSAGSASGYDFENHLTSSSGIISMVYDGDGNRVKKTVNGVTTTYLVDGLNPTGYSQVVLQTTGSETRQFVYGLERLSQRRNTEVRYYGYDGHGSVRLLTDSSGTVTDTYDYDAFGNIVNSSGVTPNEFLFAGEQFDQDLGLYYNRARYLNTNSGRFWSMDSYEGDAQSPASLHKYLYANADPVALTDPSGFEIDELGSAAVETTLATQPALYLVPLAKVVEATAAVAATQISITTYIAAALAIIAVASQQGDSKPGPRGTDRNRTAHVGRLQVQGQDILRSNTNGLHAASLLRHPDFRASGDTVSWAWRQPFPLDAPTALAKLSEFLQVLTPDEIFVRRYVFPDVSRFIVNSAAGGGVVGPFKRPFNAGNQAIPDARIDVEVLSGLAFVPIP